MSEVDSPMENSDSINPETFTLPDFPQDDVTPFNSPRIMANLSLNEDGDLQQEVDVLKEVTDEQKAESLKIKAEANTAFGEKDFKKAIELYTAAIALNPRDHIFWSNRSMAKMKLEEYGGAAADASEAITLSPRFAKAYYRRGLAQLAIMQPKAAIIDFKTVISIEPNNKEARTQLDSTQKLVRRIEFEKAIAVGDGESASQRCRRIIQDGGCPIETTYVGPMMSKSDDTAGQGDSQNFRPTVEFIEAMIQWFKDGKTLCRRYAWEIVLGCQDVLKKENTLVDIPVEEGCVIDVIGDTHGQFYDLLHLLSLTGPPSEKHILLFNGDFVDRGSWSVEVALTLFCYKWLYPNRVFLHRGNHETQDMNKVYGFEGEVKHKHGEITYKLFSDVFTALPLSSVICPTLAPSSTKSEGSQPAILSPEGRKRYFVVHGGLFSKDDVTLDDIRKIDRFDKQPGQDGLMMECLWTDPQDQPGRGPSKRGVGVGFGPDVTRRWCELNGITAVLRSHEVRQGGYAIEHDGLCITVFSAPNYCDSTGNKGAYIRIDANGQCQYTTFEHVTHPPMRPMAYSGGFGGLM